MSGRSALDPRQPLDRCDLDQVREMLAARSRPLGHSDVPKTARLVNCRLNRGPTDTGQRSDLVVRQIADAMMFDLAGNDAEHGTLSLGVVMAQCVRQRT